MKKILVLLTVLLLIGVRQINAKAANLNYVEISNVSHVLREGIEYRQVTSSVTNDLGVSTEQNVNVVLKDLDVNQVQVATWSMFTSAGNLTFGSVEEIAQDFEDNNPGYKVMAAVNGDYFAYSPSRTINANVNFNGDIVKAQNHSKYLSVGFNQYGGELTVSKTVSQGDYYLSIYHPSTNRLTQATPITGLNAVVLGDEQTTVYYGATSIEMDGAKKYLVKTPMGLSFMDAHLFAKGAITTHTTDDLSLLSNEFAVVTKDENLMLLLDQNPIIRVQKSLIEDYVHSTSIIGVDSQILKDGVVRSFDAIGGQSVSNNTSRHPRTSFGITEEGNFIIATVDGRQSSSPAGITSYGVDLRELATIMKAYGSVQAFNIDGGGSSQMVVRNNLNELVTINSPSEGPHFPTNHTSYKSDYRSVGNALLFIVPDIGVNANYTDFTKDSLILNYTITTDETIEIIDKSIYVNGIRTTLEDVEDQLELNALIENGINTFSFEFTYIKDGKTMTRTFGNKVINLSANSGIREPQEPTNFTVEFENIENTSNFKVKVCYEDPDRRITKISVKRVDNNQSITALVQYAGCRAATIENATLETNYEFEIIYYFNMNTESKILDNTFNYTYRNIEETPIEEPVNETPHTSESNNNGLLIAGLTIGSILFGGGVVIIIMRKLR